MPGTRQIPLLLALVCVIFSGSTLPANAQSTGMVQFYALGRVQKGIELAEFAHEMIIMGRDGWIHSINPSNRSSRVDHIDEKYQPASTVEMRNRLRKEFGPRFEVVATKNFLVVQPKNRGDRWPKLFESSHRSFYKFMKKKGVRVRPGRFPMVAVVFPDQTAMYAEFKRLKIDASRVAGLYAGESNRVMTHDGGRSSSIEETVRHETAHQSAFNSGVHSRVNDMPRWITEGVGQMFEPEAMLSGGSVSVRDRVNRESIRYMLRNYSDRNDTNLAKAMMQLVSDNSMFKDDGQIEEAYNVSWAMMFYLSERKPKAFAKLLNHTASRPPFREYARKDRIKDFERIVGVETFEFSKRVSWYLQEL
jgi:hypothetical protein